MENNENNTHRSDDSPIEDLKETAQKIDQVWVQVEKERPTVKLGVLLVTVGIGSYFGVGRHVIKLRRDVKTLNKSVKAISEFMTQDLQFREAQKAAIDWAVENGHDFTHFPGVGVMLRN